MKNALSAFAAFAVVASFSLPAASHDWRSHFAREVPYRVVNVGPRGVLNVRSRPSVRARIVARLRPGQSGFFIKTCARHATWCLIDVGTIQGWVNMRYLGGYAT